MDNIQLAILLDKYASLLGHAMNEVAIQLPEEFNHSVKNIFGQEVITIPVLDPINDILNCIREDADELRKSKGV